MGWKKVQKTEKISLRNIYILGAVIAFASFAAVYGITTRNASTSKRPIQTQCDGTCVAVYSDRADPEVITITSGSYVQFNSADAQKHNLSIGGDNSAHHENAEQYSSNDFNGDEAWRVQFKQDGAYTFKDKYHPKISINVIVYTPGKDYKIQ